MDESTNTLLSRIVKQLDAARTIPSVPARLRARAADDAVDYIRGNERFNNVAVHLHNVDALRAGLAAATLTGVVAEFGVHTGRSLTVIAEHFSEQLVHGFDSFVGLPENWGGTAQKQGSFDLGGSPPQLDVSNVEFHVGWFEETIPVFARQTAEPLAFAHIDSDLYSSAATIFEQLSDRFVPSTVIVFDEYFGYHGWENHEHRAFMEFLAASRLDYEAIALGHMNLAVRLR